VTVPEAGAEVVFELGRHARGAAPFLCDQLAALLDRSAARVVVCDVAGLERPGPADLDHLARLRTTARRHGREMRLRGVRPELRLLLELTGLWSVLGDNQTPSDASAQADGLPVEPGRQAEEREQAVGVEEVGHRGDAAV
jgi:anti-anti-sigma regulatory factor